MADERIKFQASFRPKEAGEPKKRESRWNQVERVPRTDQQERVPRTDQQTNHHGYSPEEDKPAKRRSTEYEGEPEKKKMAIGGFGFLIGQKKPSVVIPTMATAPSEPQRKSPVSMIPVSPIKMTLGNQKPKKEPQPTLKKASAAVASVFNQDSEDSDPEEMPPEAKMRMRNIGRETPTAAGPNSYGKGRLGFCDRQKIIERELKKSMDKV